MTFDNRGRRTGPRSLAAFALAGTLAAAGAAAAQTPGPPPSAVEEPTDPAAGPADAQPPAAEQLQAPAPPAEGSAAEEPRATEASQPALAPGAASEAAPDVTLSGTKPSPAAQRQVPERVARDERSSGDTYFKVGEIQVVGKRRRHLESQDVLTSVSIIGSDQIKNESVDEPVDLLRRVPGVFTQEFNQGIISSDLGIRGFNTQGDVAPLKLLIDGIPSNLHIGMADMKPIFPLDIERIELVRGTNDPRYGLYSVAGNLQVFTRRGGNYTLVRGTAGSFNTYEAQAASAYEGDRLTQNLFGAFRYSQGYREHSQMQKYALSGKWFFRLAEPVRVGVIARMFRMEPEAAGYLPEQLAPAAPRSSPAFSQTDGGLQSNRHASLHLDWDLARNLFWSLKGYHQTVKRKRFVRFTMASAQQERYEWEKQNGGLTQLTYRPGGLGVLDDLVLSAGADVQNQDNVFRRFVTDNNRNRATTNRDQAFDLVNYGAFVQADLRPWRWLRLMGGVRWDRLDGELHNVLAGSEPTPMIDFGNIWQPKVGALITPVEGYNLYGNYGRSFQVPVRDGLYSRQDLTWSKNDGWEAGLKVQPLAWLTGRLAYWRQRASDEVRLKFNSPTDAENVGSTLRHGMDVEAGISPVKNVYLWSSFTYQRSKLLEPGANLAVLRGSELDHVPRYLLKTGLDVRPLEPLTASVSVFAQGDYSLTDSSNVMAIQPSGRSGGFTLVNLDLLYSWQKLTFGGHVKNLLDAGWNAAVWNDGTTTLVNPGDSRAFLVSVETSF